jgi:hypothetical protein
MVVPVLFSLYRPYNLLVSYVHLYLGVMTSDFPAHIVYNPYNRLHHLQSQIDALEEDRAKVDLARYDVVTPGNATDAKLKPVAILGQTPKNLARRDLVLEDPLNAHFGSAVFDRYPDERELLIPQVKTLSANVSRIVVE